MFPKTRLMIEHGNPQRMSLIPLDLCKSFILTTPINQIFVHALRLMELIFKRMDDVTKCQFQNSNL